MFTYSQNSVQNIPRFTVFGVYNAWSTLVRVVKPMNHRQTISLIPTALGEWNGMRVAWWVTSAQHTSGSFFKGTWFCLIFSSLFFSYTNLNSFTLCLCISWFIWTKKLKFWRDVSLGTFAVKFVVNKIYCNFYVFCFLPFEVFMILICILTSCIFY